MIIGDEKKMNNKDTWNELSEVIPEWRSFPRDMMLVFRWSYLE
jgi:hypothetical protein